MGRAPCCEKVGLKRGRWTSEEDDILTKYIQANGEGSWRSLPKNAGLLRCGKSCRLRWINYLRDDLKRGNISGEEENIIIKLHASFGNKWSLIASQLPGRTDNEIKNYWNSHLSRKIDTFRRPNSEPLPIIMNLGISSSSTSKKKGGRTSRAAMKKNKSNTKTTTTTTKIVKTNMVKVKESGGGVVVMSLPSTPMLERDTLPISTMDFDSMFVEEIEKSIDDDPPPPPPPPPPHHHHHQEPDQMVEEVLVGPPHGVGSFNDMLIINHTNEESESGGGGGGGGGGGDGGGGGGCSSTTTNSSNNVDDGPSSSSGGKEVVDWDWDWEDLIHDNFWNEQEQQHQDQEQDQLLSWLWDSNDNYNNIIGGGGQIQNLQNFSVDGMDNSENQDALVAWLLS